MDKLTEQRKLYKINEIKRKLNHRQDRSYIGTYKYLATLAEAVLYNIISENEYRERLQEMSKEWPVIESHLLDTLPIRWEHLIKMYYYKDFQEYHSGWVDSCKKGLEKIDTLKKTHKYPSFEKLYNSLWEEEKDTLKDFHDNNVETLNKDYDKVPTIAEMDFAGIQDFIQKFTEWSCRQLSKKGGITKDATKNEIYELLGIE